MSGQIPEGVSRINVVGASGSGKSSLAKQIAQSLKLTYFEMEKYFGCPTGKNLTTRIFLKTLTKLCKKRPGY